MPHELATARPAPPGPAGHHPPGARHLAAAPPARATPISCPPVRPSGAPPGGWPTTRSRPGAPEEFVLTDPFDYEAEDRLIDAWQAAVAALPDGGVRDRAGCRPGLQRPRRPPPHPTHLRRVTGRSLDPDSPPADPPGRSLPNGRVERTPGTSRLTRRSGSRRGMAGGRVTGGHRLGSAAMTLRVVVWGTGNVGRPAIRAVAAHRDLELVGRGRGQPGQGRSRRRRAGRASRRSAWLATDDVVGGARRRRRLRRSTRPPPTPGPMEAYGDLARLPAGRPQRRVDRRSTRCCTRRARPASCSTWSSRACARGRHVGVRVGHRPGLGARHPPRRW